MAKAKRKTKKKVGRPTKYKKVFCDKLIDFFDVEPYEKIELPHYHTDGKTLKWMDYKIIPARMPTLRKFAKSICIGVRTVYEWIDPNHRGNYQEEFARAFMCAKEIRKEWLIDLGLSGLTPPLSYKFTAINVTDMVDTKVIKGNEDEERLTKEERDDLRNILRGRQKPLKLVRGA